MSKRIIIVLISLFLLLLVACGGSETVEPEANVSPTDVPVEEDEEMEEPTKEPAPTDEPTPTEEPAPEPTVEPVVEAITTNLTDGCVESYDESVDYYPEKAEIIYTEGFSVEYFNNYKVVTVHTPFPGAEEAATYLLVQCGTPAPEGFEDAVVIETPVDNFVAMSTSYLPFLEELGILDRLVGLDSFAFASTEAVRSKIDAGELAEIGAGGEVNIEVVLDLDPALVMTYASGFADYDAHPKLEEAGMTVALNADYLDTSPLGRTEWAKFVALFFNKEGVAESWFNDIATEYEELVDLTAVIDTRPTVFTDTPFDGTWYVSGGQSFSAQLLADAGADYLWADDESTGSLYLDFETVFDVAADADYWINIGFFGSLDELVGADERYAEFAAFQNGTVFNNNLRVNELGGNDYYEGGVSNPHLVLADLIGIFHPELLPDHEFTYFQPVE